MTKIIVSLFALVVIASAPGAAWSAGTENNAVCEAEQLTVLEDCYEGSEVADGAYFLSQADSHGSTDLTRQY